MTITPSRAQAAFQTTKALREGSAGWREAANIVDAYFDQAIADRPPPPKPEPPKNIVLRDGQIIGRRRET